jgi:hypothetical protein
MKTKNPMIGLLKYLYYDSAGNIKIAIAVAIIMAIAALITNNSIVKNIFILVSVAGIPYLLLMKMGGKSYPKWERFQLTMPIKRSQLIGSQYLCMLFGVLIGLPLVIIVGAINFIIHDIDYPFVGALVNTLSTIGMPLTMTGVLFLLGTTKFGENKGEVFFLVGLVAAVGLDLLITTFIGNILQWHYSISSIISFATAVIIFTTSYLVTSKLYGKIDF